MSKPYHRIEDKMKHATAHCPVCLKESVKYHNDAVFDYECLNCGWHGEYEELAFMKLRNHPDGAFIPGLKGGRNTKKIGDDIAELVVMNYKGTNDTIEETAKKFNISQATAARMIRRVNESKPIPGRSSKYRETFIRKVVAYHERGGSILEQTAEKFGLTYDTVRYMIRKIKAQEATIEPII